MSLPAPDTARLGAAAYVVPRPRGPIDLWLDGNEGPTPDPICVEALAALDPEVLRRYPSAGPLEADLAARYGVEPDQVYVTAGADEAIDRFCRAYLRPGQNAVVLTPAFEMQLRYTELAGASVRGVAWTEGAFPLDAVLAAVDENTVCVALATPNNPTGLSVPDSELRRLAAALPDVWLLLDLVYADFLPEDPTGTCLQFQNAIVLRSFSKSGGLAGLRVGYALGPAAALAPMRRAGGPYSVGSPSLAVARQVLATPPDFAAYREQVATERQQLTRALEAGGCAVGESMANFVLARTGRAAWLVDGLAGQGIAVRGFPGRPDLADAVRLTCPGAARAAARLTRAVSQTLRPEALLFDMDGVLVDVRESYDAAIIAAAAAFDVEVTHADIEAAKGRGGANNDWHLTRGLLADAGRTVSLDAVTEAFEAAYLGGLWQRETLTVPPALLRELAAILPLGIVTGRPRRDAERFLAAAGIDDLFPTVVCMEDAPQKPRPDPVQKALEGLGVETAWLLGDTVDDVHAARAAGVLPLGIPAPGADRPAVEAGLLRAGAARVLRSISDLLALLPGTPGGGTSS